MQVCQPLAPVDRRFLGDFARRVDNPKPDRNGRQHEQDLFALAGESMLPNDRISLSDKHQQQTNDGSLEQQNKQVPTILDDQVEVTPRQNTKLAWLRNFGGAACSRSVYARGD